jgi:hypothetical protein
MENNLESRSEMARIDQNISKLFYAHWIGTGFDWRMRRCSDPPVKDSACWEFATPDTAKNYLEVFINPYSQALLIITEQADFLKDQFPEENFIQNKIDPSLVFVKAYGELLDKFSKEDVNSENYNEIVTQFYEKFNDLGIHQIYSGSASKSF